MFFARKIDLILFLSQTGKVLSVYVGHKGPVNGVAVKGFTLYSAGNDSTIREWDVRVRVVLGSP
jgi:WD40 repeat protein